MASINRNHVNRILLLSASILTFVAPIAFALTVSPPGNIASVNNKQPAQIVENSLAEGLPPGMYAEVETRPDGRLSVNIQDASRNHSGADFARMVKQVQIAQDRIPRESRSKFVSSIVLGQVTVTAEHLPDRPIVGVDDIARKIERVPGLRGAHVTATVTEFEMAGASSGIDDCLAALNTAAQALDQDKDDHLWTLRTQDCGDIATVQVTQRRGEMRGKIAKLTLILKDPAHAEGLRSVGVTKDGVLQVLTDDISNSPLRQRVLDAWVTG
ncbi:hypothetical protein QVA66_03670 [Staphylococcus chromogenes]|nr:hypothetical protein [Staphylococcus chromogenes]